MATTNLCESVPVFISVHQPDPFRKQSSSAPDFLGFDRSDSTSSDEGVVMADCPTTSHTVLTHSASLETDVRDCDLNRRRESILITASGGTSEGGNDMRVARNRLNSFVNWPLTHQSPSAMSGAGFYYTGISDFVKCAFCEGVLGNWRLTDCPVEEHRRHFPRCALVVSVLLGGEGGESSASSTPSIGGSDSGEDVCGFYFPCRNPEPVLVPTAPSVPEMALYKDRFATFARWPRDKVQTPRDLASAGLFYTGDDDQTQCFHCLGNLHRWEPQDDPWTEHARFYPKCQYLIASKGQDFINMARRGMSPNPEDQVLVRASLTNSSQASSSGWTPSRSQSSGFEEELPSSSSSHESGSFSDRSMSDEESEEGVIGHTVMQNSHLMDAIQEAVQENRQNLSFSRFRSSEHLLQAAKAIQSRKEIQKEMIKKESERILPVVPSDMTSLTKEYERLKNERVCKVCLDRESQFIFHPCGHLVCCAVCAEGVQTCPICRTFIAQKSRVYLS